MQTYSGRYWILSSGRKVRLLALTTAQADQMTLQSPRAKICKSHSSIAIPEKPQIQSKIEFQTTGRIPFHETCSKRAHTLRHADSECTGSHL
jgi:hypothetical protein